MNSTVKKTVKMLQILTAVLMVFGLLFPPMSVAFAQDAEPPAPADTGEAEAPADPPADEQAAEPPADEDGSDPQPVDIPPEQTVEAPSEAEMPVDPAGSGLPVEQTVEPPVEVVTEPEPAAAGEEAAGEAETEPVEAISEIVEAMAETNTVLVDENNVEIPLSSEEAVEVLENADPFFKSGSTYIGYTSFGGSCASFVSVCYRVANPVSSALSDPLLVDNATLYIEGYNSGGGKLYNEAVTINKAVNLQAGRNFSKYGGNIYFDSATAIINQITLAANLGTINNVFANTIMVDGYAGATDEIRGAMLDDALAMIAEYGDINLTGGTFKDDANGFRIASDGVSLEGVGEDTVIDGNASSYGNGIEIDGDHVTVRKLKVIGSYDGIDIDDGDDITLDSLTLTENHTGLNVQSGAYSIRINYSNIFGNNHWGIFTESSDTVDARYNYWGSPYGPTLCSGQGFNPVCGEQRGDAIWSMYRIDYDPFQSTRYCPYGMEDVNGICLPLMAECDPGLNDVDRDGECEVSDCLPGQHDVNNDNICEASTCLNGFTDANFDGVCETSACENGWTDTNHDGVCESSNCANGWTDTDHDNVCESSGCTAGKTDYDHNNTCEASICLPGEHDVNSDGACEPSTCNNGFTDVDFDGVCDSSNCPAGKTDYDHNNTCEASLCLPGEHDVNSDGVCETSTCENGFTDINFDGICETSNCTNGNTDFDHDGDCESSGCLAGTNDMDCNGVCVQTVCAMNTFDANADGGCEHTVCKPGFNDKDSDGLCVPTVCPQGRNDTDSDGLCEEDEGEDPLLAALGLFGPFAVAGQSAVIPVTGGMNELSCTEANTLVLPDGNSVEFSGPLCHFAAGLDALEAGAMPGALPDGLTFVSAISLTVQQEAETIGKLPEPMTQTMTFVIGDELKDKTFVILYWDAAAKEGLGDWVKVPTDTAGAATINYTGTFVLAYE